MLQRKCVGLTWKSKVTGNFGDIFKAKQKPSSPGFCLPLLKSAWDLVYPRPNRDVRDISRNLIGCLEDWELEKTIFLYMSMIYNTFSFLFLFSNQGLVYTFGAGRFPIS